jgi:hypothetical protein
MSNLYYSVESEEHTFSLEDDVLKIINDDGTVRDEFDITTIAHIQCVTSHEDHKLLGLIVLAIGASTSIIGSIENFTSFIILGIAVMIIGTTLLAYNKNETIFQVTLQGINNTFQYKISERPEGINQLINKINKRRSTLRNQ